MMFGSRIRKLQVALGNDSMQFTNEFRHFVEWLIIFLHKLPIFAP